MKSVCLSFVVASLTLSVFAAADDLPKLGDSKRIVFLGDSITYSGQYIEVIDAYLAVRYPGKERQLVNLGLPSETVTGLSEPGHANGQFPRPNVHERLERVLKKTKPDLVIACYGMNCGMYYPFGQDRFEKFKAGIEKLHQAVEDAGGKIIHVTPPTFDSQPIRDRTLPAGQDEYRQPYVGYNEVLDRYSQWLVGQRSQGWEVIDLHSKMNEYLAERRKSDEKFALAADGVHVNAEGQWLIAKELLRGLGVPNEELDKSASAEDFLRKFPSGEQVLKLVQQKQRLLKDAWLTDVGHLRPGMRPGRPLSEALTEAQQLDKQIRATVTK